MKRVALLLFIWLSCLPLSGKVYSENPSVNSIRLAVLQNDIHHLPLWVALDNGFFREQGINVEIAGIFRAGPEIMSAFSAGSLDMAYVGEAPTVTAVANGTAKVVILAQVNTEGSAIVVGKNSPIRTISDLKGKHVAIPGYSTVQDLLLRKALSASCVDPRQIKMTVIKPPEMIGALRTDQIDAFIAWEPYPAQAICKGVGKTLASSSEIWKDHPCCVLVADRQFAQANDEKMERMLKAHREAVDFIRDNPDEALRIAIKHTGLDEQTAKQAIEKVKYVSNLNVEGLKEYVNHLKELGYIKLNNVGSFVKNLVY
ncbi:MAG: ABC transporter substrate-binding protein [Deltaproteobacteria bacterium]|nr:ABC transporter substrate-binding protein [Deltaproteobacteria bacterium]